MELRVLSWNLFHGRDSPPDRSLQTWRSRLLRITERGSTHAQVNRELYEQFAAVLAGAEWDVALLQEVPPRWAEPLATDCGAEPHLVLTSRNLIGALQNPLARFNPDLIAAWEGGANLTLVRTLRATEPVIRERRMLTLAWRPERRRMSFTRLRGELSVANLHASTARPKAELELQRAAATAHLWSEGGPLILGGDLNIRPSAGAGPFEALEARYGLHGAVASESIDQILARGLEIVEPAHAWEPARREVPDPTDGRPGRPLPIRLSDHAPVEARLRRP